MTRSEVQDLDNLTDYDAEVREALFGAVRRGDAERVQQLLIAHHHAAIDQLNTDGDRPLTIALAEGHAGVVEVLLKNGAHHSYTDMSGNTPLHIVARKGNYEALRVFLKNVKLPAMDRSNNAGDTALMVPAAGGFSVVVECLLQHNANPNTPNQMGRTPIMAAASKGHKDVIKVLLKYGADILLTSYEDYSGMPTTLKEAVAYGSADITAFVTQSCNTAMERLERLFTCKTREEMTGLIRSGCSVNHRRGDGCTPLMLHAESGNLDVVITLLEAHAFMDAQDKNGETALMKASFGGRVNVVKDLVVKGALIDLKCRLGRTALMYGVMGGSLEVCKCLVQSGADASISDKSGSKAQDLTHQDEIFTFLQGRSSVKPTEEDPFAAKISEYLQLQKMQHTGTLPQDLSTRSDSPRRYNAGRHIERLAAEVPGGRERPGPTDATTQELHRYIERVAELETRVEELTIRADFSLLDEEDLSYYRDQPERLIEEYKKLKATKKKAEQFAIEAKQSAQKASVDLSHIKEELLREKHSNELKIKHMVSDMEQSFTTKEEAQHIFEERERTHKTIIRALESQKSPEEISHLKDSAGGMTTHKYTSKEVFNVIVNSETKTHFKVTLVAISGLPKSGKSILVRKLMPNTAKDSENTNGLTMVEVGYCETSRRNALTRKWEEFKREDIYMHMLVRALANRNRKLPMLEEWTELPRKCLNNDYLRMQFKNLYCKMREGLLRFAETESEFRFHLMSEPTYVLLNVWDIGFNKALHESLPLIARLMQPLVLLDVIDLYRDRGESLRKKPEVNDNTQSIMRGRSRGHYCVRIAGLCQPPGRCILIGTNKDKLPGHVSGVVGVKRLTEAGLRVKASAVGADAALHSEMLAIDLSNNADCNTVKRCVEDIIESTTKFNEDLHLTWIFLRTVLIDYKAEISDFLMSRAEFDNLARQCGLKSTEEIEDCLKFFTRTGSLLSHESFFGDKIIYRPYKFFDKLNALYNVSDKTEDEHTQQCLRVGILCKQVAVHIWGKEKEFFWQLMQGAGVATPTKSADRRCSYDYKIKCPHAACRETNFLVVSSVCKKRLPRRMGMHPDSLYVSFRKQYVPGDILVHFVRHIGENIPGIRIKNTEWYNFTEFELPEGGGQFQVIVHGDVLELVTANLHESSNLEITSILKGVCITILDSMLKYFPGFEYQLCLRCDNCFELSTESDDPPNKSTISYLHFLPAQYETQLFCRICKKMTQLSSGQMKWMQASLKEEQSYGEECYEARIVSEAELAQVTRHIPLHNYKQICTTLGQSQPQTISEEAVVAVLVAWQCESTCNRREKLAKILLRMGCYTAALKLQPTLLDACTEEVPPHPSQGLLSDIEIETVSNCAVGWKNLAQALNIPSHTICKIDKVQYYSERDRCRCLLNSINGSDTREKIVKALLEIGWKNLAEGLECGRFRVYTSQSPCFSL